jgi:uncharacterized protein (UPF0210 family)
MTNTATCSIYYFYTKNQKKSQVRNTPRHSRESGNLVAAGVMFGKVPAFAGMTGSVTEPLTPFKH